MRLKRLIAEALNESDFDLNEIEEKVKYLKGQNFVGILKGDIAEITDITEKGISANFAGSFDTFIKDGFSLEDLKEYSHFIRDRKQLEGKGYIFADWIHQDFSDSDIIDFYLDSDENSTWSFYNLDISLNDFDGDFDKLTKEIDEYVQGFRDKYEEIKARISPEQIKKVKRSIKTIANKKNATRELFKNGTVVDEKQEWNRSHGTFTSNHTSGGTYAIEYANKGLTKKDIQQYDYLVINNINIPKPKGSIYSSITGAKKEDIEKKIKSGDFIVTKDIIKFEGLPYTDLFIGD